MRARRGLPFAGLAACISSVFGCGATPTPPPALPTTNVAATADVAPALPGRAPSAAERRAIEPLERTAERIRDLHFLRPVPVRVQTAEEITAFVQASLERDELERARRFYVTLGMLPADLDIEAMLLAVMGEQIVGYYDPERDVMVIRDDVLRELARGSDAESSSVLVHEYVHALQDQNLALSEAMEVERSIDGDNAFSSVVEGDATLAMIGFMTDVAHVPLQTFTHDITRVQALLDQGLSTRGDELMGAPPIVRVPLLSHYFDGMLLCATLHGTRAWEGVDALHHAPPSTTEQVLHPERYLSGELGEEVVLPTFSTLESAGYAVLDEDTLGELELSIFLGRGTDRDRAAGEGWGGDRVRVYVRGEESAAVWFTSWDTEPDAIEAEAAIARAPRVGDRVLRSGRALLFTAGLDASLSTEVEAAFTSWSATLPPR